MPSLNAAEESASCPRTRPSLPSGAIAQPDSTFDVSFTSSDATSGLQGVRLFYRHNRAAWTQYGTGLFTSSPINFDTASAEGSGTNEYYTEGIDNAGNVEDKPAQGVEATVLYTNNTRVMSWQQIED